MAEAFIVGRALDDTDPVLRDGEVLCVPMLFRDGNCPGGDLLMTDGTSLSDRLRFASPEVRQRLGLPPQHLEDGKGNIAGHAPGYLLPPGPAASPDSRRPTDKARPQAYADYVARLTSAWKNP
jgi:hypothetical protein